MLAITELIKEVVDLVSTLIILLDIKPDQSSLYEWDDFFEQLSLILLDNILIKGIVRVHKLSLLIFIFTKLV